MYNIKMAEKLKKEDLEIGKYTKLFWAFAKLHGLKPEAVLATETYQQSLVVSAIVSNYWMESVCDIFQDDVIGYVSSLRTWKPVVHKDTLETSCRSMLLGAIGEHLTIKSFKGGYCCKLVGNKYHLVPRFEVRCPQTMGELMLKLAAAGIDPDFQDVQICEHFC